MFQSTYTSWIKILQHLTFEINHRKWGGGGGEGRGVQMLIFELQEATRVCLPSSTQKNYILIFITCTYLWNIIVSTTQTPPQITSQEFISHIKQHFITTNLLTHITNGIQEFVKCCIRSWLHLNLWLNNMLFSILQPLNVIISGYFVNKNSSVSANIKVLHVSVHSFPNRTLNCFYYCYFWVIT